jgi:hypothetical protein
MTAARSGVIGGLVVADTAVVLLGWVKVGGYDSAMETWTLILSLYAGAGRHEMASARGLSESVCRMWAAEVIMAQAEHAYCRRSEPICAHGAHDACTGPLPGRRRV